MLVISNKQLIDEGRNIEVVISKIKITRNNLLTQIQELRLENDMAGTDLEKV